VLLDVIQSFWAWQDKESMLGMLPVNF
jgi:hypothetical protein